MELKFVKASPCRNTTVFITETVEKAHYADVARLALDSDYLAAEQVGFITSPHSTKACRRLEMAGGEFCGNATLSLAAWLVKEKLVDSQLPVLVECSGAAQPICCEVTPLPEAHFRVREELFLQAELKEMDLKLGFKKYPGVLVREPGIVHFLYFGDCSEQEQLMLLDALEAKEKADACGVIVCECLTAESYRIRPLVGVPAAGSRVFEQACGSGSMALGLWLAESEGRTCVLVQQPGGSIFVETGEAVHITTEVYFPCEGTMLVPQSVLSGLEDAPQGGK